MSKQYQEGVPSIVFVGTYSQRGSEGIYVFHLDPETGTLTKHNTIEAYNASFLAQSPNRRLLYAVHETSEFRGQPGGSVSAYSIDAATGQLSFLNQQGIPGRSPCHVQIDPHGRWLITANFQDGTHTVLSIQKDGSLGPVADHITNAGTLGPEQKSAHAHCSLFTAEGHFVYICDLGLDRVIVYALDAEHGLLTEQTSISLASGAGPRHLIFHPSRARVYVLNERNSTVTVLNRDLQTESLTLRQTLSTLPAEYHGRNSPADLHLSADGQFLYASNRGHDSLAVFALDQDGQLSIIGHTPTQGRGSRNFALLPNGLILVASQEDDCIVAFRAGPDGMPVPTGAVTHVPAPTCVFPVSIPLV